MRYPDCAQLKAPTKASDEKDPVMEVARETTNDEIIQARGVAKVLRLFSGIGEVCDCLASMFIQDCSSVVDYSMAGDAAHMLMDTAGWEKLRRP